jgi:hypothetical protein
MGDAENQGPMSSLSLNATVPCKVRCLSILRQLAQRPVDYIGYHEALGEEVVGFIDQAMLGTVKTDTPRYTAIERRLATTDSDMLVRIRYLGAPTDRVGATAIESLLETPDADGVQIKRLRRGMNTMVLGREPGCAGADCCELTLALFKDP